MSLPERFHHFHHSYNGPGPNFGPVSRLERPNSVCSNTSSIDEVDEGDEHSGQSGSGSSAQNTTSYVGRRRLFQAPQTQQQHHHHYQHQQQHQPQLPLLQHFSQHTQPHFQPPHHHQAVPMSLQARRTYSDDQIAEHPLYGSGSTSQSLLGTSAGSSNGGNLRGHSGLSKSWISGSSSGGATTVTPSSPSSGGQGMVEISALSLQQQHQQAQPHMWLGQRRPSALVSDVLHEHQDDEAFQESESTPRPAARTIFPDESLVAACE